MRCRSLQRASATLVLSGALGLTAHADTLTLCTQVTEYVQITRGFFIYDACPKQETVPQSDGKAETPLGDPQSCWTFLQPSNPYDELPPFAFKLPVTPVTPDASSDSAGAMVAPPAETPIAEGP